MNLSEETGSSVHSDHSLRGGGQAGERLRAIDWRNHPLGPPQTWSAALHFAIRLLLATRSTAGLYWGPGRIFFYNDGMIPALGGRHPWAQGAPGAEVWSEIWSIVEPQLQGVETTGEGQMSERQRLRIGSGAEARDTLWTYSHTLIEDETAPTRVGGVLALGHDLTVEHAADERDQQDRGRLLSLFETSSTFLATLHGPDHVFEMTNAAYDVLIDRGNVIGMPVREALPEVVAQGFIEVLDQVYATGERFVARKRPVVLNRGNEVEVRWLDFVYQRQEDAEGRPIGIIAEGFDVTDHVLALQKAREANAIVDALLEYSPDLIIATGADGLCQMVSASSRDVLGYAPEDMVGQPFKAFIASNTAELSDLFARMIAGTPLRSYENRLRRKDGSTATILWSAVWSPQRELILAIGRDISDRVAAEDRWRHAEKLDAIGKLTGGIAHDFNNLLTIILGSLDVVRDALADRPELQQIADLACTAAERGAELTSQLLSYARQQPLEPVTILGAELLASLAPLIRRAVGETVSLELQIRDPAAACLADRAQVETALLNLAINARDAMPNGGTLILASGVVHSPKLSDGSRLEGAHLCIKVRDTGVGMPPPVLARAREPFFTTKPVGRGTGLGLSMVSGFAEQSGGALDLVCEGEGQGLEAAIYLPLRPMAPQDQAAATHRLPHRTTLAPAKVLLVEDNIALRQQVAFAMKQAGCEVSAAGAAAEALELLDRGHSFDLLFTDVVLPGGMNGHQLAAAARFRDPSLRVLLTSGFSLEEIGADTDVGAPLLRKPYRRRQLLAALATALGQDGEP